MSAQVSTTKLWRLCNPAAINNQLAPKHRDHLLGYSLTSAASSGLGRVKGIEVIDQFGTSPNVEIVRRDLMMLPSAKSLDGPVSAIQNPELDDFACYRIRGARRFTTQVVIDDQFVTGLHLDVKQALRLCLSASRQALSGRLDPTDALMCYKTRPTIGFPPFRGPTSDVFVANTLPDVSTLEHVNHLRELCVPAIVTLP